MTMNLLRHLPEWKVLLYLGCDDSLARSKQIIGSIPHRVMRP